MTTLRRIVSFSLMLGMCHVHAQTSKSNYEYAMEALQRKDCRTAIAYLEKYKVEHAEALKNNEEHARRVDEQIETCKRVPSGTTRIIADAWTAPFAYVFPTLLVGIVAASVAAGGGGAGAPPVHH